MQNIILVSAYLLSLASLLGYLLRQNKAKDFTLLTSWLRDIRFSDNLNILAPNEDANFTLKLMRKARQLGVRSQKALSEFYFLTRAAEEENMRREYLLRLYASRVIILSILACLGRVIFFYFFSEENPANNLAWVDFLFATLALVIVGISFLTLEKIQPLHWMGAITLSDSAKAWLKDRFFFRGEIPGDFGEELRSLRLRELKFGLCLKTDKKGILDLFIQENDAILANEQKKLADRLIFFELFAQSFPLILLAVRPLAQILR